jgi:hypothetical protein
LEEVQGATEESIEASTSRKITSGNYGRGVDEDEDPGADPPPRKVRSFNYNIEDPAVPLDKVAQDESF